MATEVGTAYLSILPSTKGFAANLGRDLDGPFSQAGVRGGDQIGAGVGKSKGFASAGVKAGGLFLAAFAAVGLAKAAGAVKDFLTDSITAGSDLGETTSKTGQIFGKSTDKVVAFAKKAAGALGQSEQAALDGASTFGIFAKSAGLSEDASADFSTEMVSLAGDLASFNNTSPEDAINAIGSALRGEAEPIRAYGVLLDDATLKNRAMALGLISNTKDALSPQNKVLAAQAEILAQTSTQQGDFARTSEGLANQQRIFSAELENTKATIGTALLPVVSDLFSTFSDVGVPALQDLAAWFIENEETVKTTAIAFVDSGLIAVEAILGIASGAARMAAEMIGWTRFTTDLWFTFVGTILEGAAAAFGWVPGVGEKLRTASDDFAALGEKTDETFAAMQIAADQTADKFDAGREAVEGLRQKVLELNGTSATVFLNAQGNAVRSDGNGNFSVKGSGVEFRAGGGPVSAGGAYIVGEREAELFVPDRPGHIYNQSQLAAMGGGEGGGVNVHVHPTPGMSETQVGNMAGRSVERALTGRVS